MQPDHLESYRALCANKRPQPMASGIMRTPELNGTLRDHQRHGVEFALRAGRSALFYDTGLGKTRMMLDWGRCVVEHSNKPVLMLAPLAVGAQHLREAETLIDARGDLAPNDGSPLNHARRAALQKQSAITSTAIL